MIVPVKLPKGFVPTEDQLREMEADLSEAVAGKAKEIADEMVQQLLYGSPGPKP